MKPEDKFNPKPKHNQGLGSGGRSNETTFIEEQVVPMGSEVYRAAEALTYISNHLKKDDEYAKVSFLFIVYILKEHLVDRGKLVQIRERILFKFRKRQEIVRYLY